MHPIKICNQFVRDYSLHLLNNEEIQNPDQVIREFFFTNELPEIRENLAILSNRKLWKEVPKKLRKVQQFKLSNQVKRLQKLVEAAHILNEQKKSKKCQHQIEVE